MQPVQTQEQVNEIFGAKNKIIELAVIWRAYIRLGHTAAAAKIKRQQGEIRRNIRTKYNIVLD